MAYAGFPRSHLLYLMLAAMLDWSRQNIALDSDLQRIGKHCKSGYETKLYIALLRPTIMFDMIRVIYSALY